VEPQLRRLLLPGATAIFHSFSKPLIGNIYSSSTWPCKTSAASASCAFHALHALVNCNTLCLVLCRLVFVTLCTCLLRWQLQSPGKIGTERLTRAAGDGASVMIRHASHVTRHTSHVTRHTSHVTRHTSHVTRRTGSSYPCRGRWTHQGMAS
jgi:hypothetical protein